VITRNDIDVARIVAWRAIHHFTHNPAFLLPAIIFPLFFFVAFAGGLSAIDDNPRFEFAGGYTAFQFCFVLMQSAAFGGVFTGFSIAADFEGRFGARMLLATRRRGAIILGYAIAALTRALVVWALLFAIALAAGMDVLGGPLDLVEMLLLAMVVNFTATLFAAGIALRARTVQAAPALQIPTFLALFLTPVYVPRDLLTGWVAWVADLNPATAILESLRSLIAGDPYRVALAFSVVAAAATVMAVWARTGMRSAERAG
jgi:ABC-2 type transport system permease protein